MRKENKQKYWIVVVSKEHTMRGVSGGFMQVCHGKETPLKRIHRDDWVIFYSSKITMEGKEKCQKFTAIGQALDDEVYQFQMSKDFIPFRRNVNFYNCKEISILPFIDKLEFIQDKSKWGYPFRFGLLEIKESDFKLIISSMLNNEK
jgi:predicted RNA-binding protein